MCRCCLTCCASCVCCECCECRCFEINSCQKLPTLFLFILFCLQPSVLFLLSFFNFYVLALPSLIESKSRCLAWPTRPLSSHGVNVTPELRPWSRPWPGRALPLFHSLRLIFAVFSLLTAFTYTLALSIPRSFFYVQGAVFRAVRYVKGRDCG